MTDQAKKYLSDILHALELIEKFTVDITDFNDYLSDLKTQSAVERQLGIIGEAVNNYDKRFPNSSLKFAKSIVGFRNRLIHAYDAIDATSDFLVNLNQGSFFLQRGCFCDFHKFK